MNNFGEKVSFIWSVADLLRGPYKPNQYGRVILPLTVLRRLDCVLEPTKDKVLAKAESLKGKKLANVEPVLNRAAGGSFHNTSKLTFEKLKGDPTHIARNLSGYINAFSSNVRRIFEKFKFEEEIGRLDENNRLFLVVSKFCDIDLHPDAVSNIEMGYVFEELIRRFNEAANETAGDHFTPREVIRLMVNLLFAPDSEALVKPGIVRTLLDPACGTGGMLAVADEYLRELNRDARLEVFGQDYNPESYAVCGSDMLIKGHHIERIVFGDTFTSDGHAGERFDYLLANPPFGVEWKPQEDTIRKEHETQGFAGRFGPGLPRINDGSPLFTGDAGSGESEIRRWIIENDWLDAIVALPDQLFYNTGIFTYIWIVTNRKPPERRGKVQLINAVHFYQKMRKSLNNKRNEITDAQIAEITRIYGDFQHNAAVGQASSLPAAVVGQASSLPAAVVGQASSLPNHGSPDNGKQDAYPTIVSKLFDNADFGFHKLTVERPLRLNFQASPERIQRLRETKQFEGLATSKKKKGSKAAEAEIEAGREIQRTILLALDDLDKKHVWKNREAFRKCLYDSLLGCGLKVPESFWKVLLAALSERDETADVCTDKQGNPEPDADLRDYENVPLKEDIEEYFQREVLPHVPDAWIDESKTKVGYELPLNRHFYQYRPPRELSAIEADIAELETEIVKMLREVVG
jgi:type I restriction enzyme M protein